MYTWFLTYMNMGEGEMLQFRGSWGMYRRNQTTLWSDVKEYVVVRVYNKKRKSIEPLKCVRKVMWFGTRSA